MDLSDMQVRAAELARQISTLPVGTVMKKTVALSISEGGSSFCRRCKALHTILAFDSGICGLS